MRLASPCDQVRSVGISCDQLIAIDRDRSLAAELIQALGNFPATPRFHSTFIQNSTHLTSTEKLSENSARSAKCGLRRLAISCDQLGSVAIS